LMVPTWSYTTGPDALHVNLFIGGRVDAGMIAGTRVHVVQKTDYPWKGTVAITLNPEESRTFTLHVRVPNRTTSKLYATTPKVSGLRSLAVNGKPITPRIVKGYAVITRHWEAGDTVELELPMEVQRLTADPRIKADTDLLALQYGPLIYNVEIADQPNLDLPLSNEPLQAEWRPDLLGGVMVITGKWQDGSPMLAVPNYARMNRVAEPKTEAGGDSSVNYAPGATNNVNKKITSVPPPPYRRERSVESKVWMRSPSAVTIKGSAQSASEAASRASDIRAWTSDRPVHGPDLSGKGQR